VAWGWMRTPAIGSQVSCAPPHSGLSSSMQTLSPHLARYAAVVVPLWPAPMMTMSYLSSLFMTPPCWLLNTAKIYLLKVRLYVSLHLRSWFPPLLGAQVLRYFIRTQIARPSEHQPPRVSGSATYVKALYRSLCARALLIGT